MIKDITGQKFGRLTAMKLCGVDRYRISPVPLNKGDFCGYFSQILARVSLLLYAEYGKIYQRGNVQTAGRK